MRIQGPAFTLHSAYQTSRRNLQGSLSRLATGDRFQQLGEGSGADLSLSQRFRHQLKRAEASTTNIQQASSYLDTVHQYMGTVTDILHRMMEVASVAADGQKSAADRKAFEAEFQVLKSEVTEMTRNAQYFGKQTIGRDAMVSYDANSERIQFWQGTGQGQEEIRRDFGTLAKDIGGTEIGFDSSEDFSMSGDGRSLYYMGTVTGDAAGKVRIKRYDIETHKVYTGTDLFDSGDTMMVDEDGSLFINGNGTLYSVEGQSLVRTAKSVTDMVVGSEFTLYGGQAIYQRTSDNAYVTADPGTGTATALTAALTFGGANDHTISGSGKYLAEEDAAGRIRVLDTRSDQEASIVIGAANSVVDLKFNADGDRIYYLNKVTNAIHTVKVSTDETGAVQLFNEGKLVQGTNSNSFNGLDLGGVNYSSRMQLAVSQDDLNTLNYEAADLRLYQLGLSNTHVDTFTAANDAIGEVQTALNRLSAERAKIGAMASRFDHVLNNHLRYVGELTNIAEQIRTVDLAKETTQMSVFQMQESAAIAMVTQYNNLSRNVLQLLQ